MNLKKRILILCSTVILVCLSFNMSFRFSGIPSVDGWTRNSSRNLHDYITEKLKPHIFPDGFCNEDSLLVVIVNSKPDNVESRRAIRETWGQKRGNLSFYFLIGELKNDNPDLNYKIKLESEDYGDIIQERFTDTYNNLTLKSVNMLKLYNQHCAEKSKYLMKIDDDVYLNVENVLEMLAARRKHTDLLVGQIINDTAPFRDASNKWYVPYDWYPSDKYPDYLCGPTYLMSSDVAQKLYNCAMETPIFYIEDVYVTGICAKKMNITPRHNSNFTCQQQTGDICQQKELFSIHYYTPSAMRRSYDTLHRGDCQRNLLWTLLCLECREARDKINSFFDPMCTNYVKYNFIHRCVKCNAMLMEFLYVLRSTNNHDIEFVSIIVQIEDCDQCTREDNFTACILE